MSALTTQVMMDLTQEDKSFFTTEVMPKSRTKTWTKKDTTWVISLFGTAVGAGILFLPITAGAGGFWPLVIMTILVGPMTYLAHRGLSRFVLSSSKDDADITDVVEEHFGTTAGKLITCLYFCAIYPILLIYGVGITNTVDSFLVNQLGIESIPRSVLSIGLILLMMSVMIAGEKLMLKITEYLVYPLVAILVFMSLYLIPEWNMGVISTVPTAGNFAEILWLTIPVLVFAFNHSPAISSFSLAQRRDYGDKAPEKAEQILKRTSTMLLGFVMFFVFSCVMSLSPAELLEARSQNLSILSYLANVKSSSFISYLGPIVAMIAITSSFFGHYLGAREGLSGMVTQQFRSMGKTVNQKVLNIGIVVFFIVTLWIVAVIDPSILGLIESLGGPVIAAILFIMPVYAVAKVPALRKYRGSLSNVFVMTMGLVSMSAIVYTLFN